MFIHSRTPPRRPGHKAAAHSGLGRSGQEVERKGTLGWTDESRQIREGCSSSSHHRLRLCGPGFEETALGCSRGSQHGFMLPGAKTACGLPNRS